MLVRMRDNATVKELNIPKDKLEVLERIVSSRSIMDNTKRTMIRKLSEGSACCICRDIPTHEVIYPLEGATRMERYCQDCIKKVYQREPVL